MSKQHPVIELAEQLIAVPSITPHDHDCQDILIKRLERLDFNMTRLPSGEVSNFWAQRGEAKPLFVYAGHTDVVPTGPKDNWLSDPFTATIRDDKLYGRGVADMKGSIAAMLIACEAFITQYPKHSGSIGFLITSGEEGNDFMDGTPIVMDYLTQQGTTIDYCLVGEPSCTKPYDTIKIGRRGSLTAYLTVIGKQGHVAFPHFAKNPIHQLAPILNELTHIEWDQGDEHFPPTSFQITNINAGTGAPNVIPGEVSVQFNLRYAPVSSDQQLRQRIEDILQQHQLNYSIDWIHNGKPFITQANTLIDTLSHVVEQKTGKNPELSTSGGTSDGRFIAPHCPEVIEFGLCNASIHQVNEWAALDDLIGLSEIYQQLLVRLLM